MVLAIEMGVVFVLLTAILIALYIAWQNAKFVGDYLKKSRPEYHLYGHLHMPHTEKEWHTTGVCIYGIGLVDI